MCLDYFSNEKENAIISNEIEETINSIYKEKIKNGESVYDNLIENNGGLKMNKRNEKEEINLFNQSKRELEKEIGKNYLSTINYSMELIKEIFLSGEENHIVRAFSKALNSIESKKELKNVMQELSESNDIVEKSTYEVFLEIECSKKYFDVLIQSAYNAFSKICTGNINNVKDNNELTSLVYDFHTKIQKIWHLTSILMPYFEDTNLIDMYVYWEHFFLELREATLLLLYSVIEE